MASTYLNRTSGTSTNAQKFTMSFWVKRSALGAVNMLFYSGTGGTANGDIDFAVDDKLSIYERDVSSVSWQLKTNRVFRDVGAWYHIVIEADSTQATSSDRIKLYVNGVQETSFDTATYPNQNISFEINKSSEVRNIGKYTTPAPYYFDGSFTHFHFIDGTAYDASTFGQTDATTGIWKPLTEPSVTYGTNGFFLKFENSGSMGTDSSGNANNFTVNGSLTQTQDTPSNLFCTINAINVASDGSGPSTLSNGNLTVSSTGTSQNVGTLAVDVNSNSKWYYEFKNISGVASNISSSVGWSTDISAFRSGSWATYNSLFLYAADGNIFGTSGWVGTGTAATYSNNDIISCTVDLQNNEIKWYKNNSLAYTISSISWVGDVITPHSQWSETGAVGSYNFGNGYFGSTAIGSPNADENGYGKFNYTPPSGFLSLCTKNINTNG